MLVSPPAPPVWRVILGTTLVLVLILLVLGFALHAVTRGLSLADPAERAASRLFHTDSGAANLAIYGHMVVGGLLTALVPLQLIGAVRRRWPRVHHASGYLLGTLALLAAIGGLTYIAAKGTIGGWPMSAGFALYGALMALAAFQTLRFARARDPRHRDWALRLVILALGSWIYRVHYGIWFALTDGLGVERDFTGIFDRVQVLAFYLPYLVLLELWLRRPGRARSAPA